LTYFQINQTVGAGGFIFNPLKSDERDVRSSEEETKGEVMGEGTLNVKGMQGITLLRDPKAKPYRPCDKNSMK
jgi:hypothetical protein